MKHLVIPDAHAHYQHNNRRADWIGQLIADERPDVVVNLGDTWDMPSLSGYDKGKRSFQGRTYTADINAGLEFEDRLWRPLRRAKRKTPARYFFIGNHEERIDRAIEQQPELEGIISYNDLDLNRRYDEVIGYDGSTPGTKTIDGVLYSHYLVSGVLARPIGGDKIATSLANKKYTSCTVGHSHLFDYAVRTRANGKKFMCLSAGCCFDNRHAFAGQANDLYWQGVIIKNNVEDGCYDLRMVSLAALKKAYGN